VETDLLVLLKEEKNSYDFLRKNLNFINDTCQIPTLDFNGEIKTIPKQPCKISKNPGYIQDNIWHFYDDQKTLECSYREIMRIDDFHTKPGESKPLKDGQKIIFEVFEVICNENKRLKFSSVFAQIVSKLNQNVNATNENLHKPNENNCTPLDVMLISYDSVSRISWIKRLPLTYKFTKETMNFEILNGYNIVGDGTPAGKIF